MILYHGSNVEIEVVDLRTGLYSQSTTYVYSFLEHELLTGKLG